METRKPVAGDLIISTNEFRTIFVDRVEADGETLTQIATSSTFRRVRGLFHHDRWCRATDFTFPRIQKEGTALVQFYLAQIGIDVPGAVYIRQPGGYSKV